MRGPRAVRSLAIVLGAVAYFTLASAAWGDAYANDGDGRLYLFRSAKREPTYLGQVQVGEGDFAYTPSLTDIAFDAGKGLFANSFSDLYRIDLDNPHRSTLVGSFGGISLNALAFDDEGRLYGAGDGGLYTIDIKTGRATYVGSFGGSVLGSDGDLAFREGRLLATLRTNTGTVLAHIDTATGKASTLLPLLTADDRRVGDVWGLAFDGKVLLAFTQAGEVLEVDAATGKVKSLARTRARYWGASPALRL